MSKWQICDNKKITKSPVTNIISVQESNTQYFETDYINKETDQHLIEQFCAMTEATTETAIAFLKITEWNVLFAVNKYYATNGTLSDNQTLQSKSEMSNDMIYNHGIPFWYWEKQKSQKIHVVKKFPNLKEELLHFRKFTTDNWNNLVADCNDLMKTSHIRRITSNGYNADIYQIQNGISITISHMFSIKLYTDYSWLCSIFCKAF
eukprot:274240_1